MDIKIKYNNDTPPFEISLPVIKGWDTPIIELSVEGTSGRSRKVALNDYVVNLANAFRGLINKHETNIEELIIENCFIGNVHKLKDDLKFVNSDGEEDLVSKYDLILFTIYKDFLNEQLYCTRNQDILHKGDLMFEGNTINTKILDRVNTEDRRFVDSLITAVTYHLPDYDIRVNEETKKLEYTYKGAVLKTIDEVKQDDIFVFFKLVEVLLSRGRHTGVFFLDCEFLSSGVINAMVAFINLYYLRNRLIFLYNVANSRNSLKDIPRERVVLPNQKIPHKEKLNKK